MGGGGFFEHWSSEWFDFIVNHQVPVTEDSSLEFGKVGWGGGWQYLDQVDDGDDDDEEEDCNDDDDDGVGYVRWQLLN